MNKYTDTALSVYIFIPSLVLCAVLILSCDRFFPTPGLVFGRIHIVDWSTEGRHMVCPMPYMAHCTASAEKKCYCIKTLWNCSAQDWQIFSSNERRLGICVQTTNEGQPNVPPPVRTHWHRTVLSVFTGFYPPYYQYSKEKRQKRRNKRKDRRRICLSREMAPFENGDSGKQGQERDTLFPGKKKEKKVQCCWSS